ncbi:MAG TPA: hypothetical protein VHJ20_20275 [Polyangia bacterium]|nr:hypothetical protein [Polyangia bacterium]
MKFRSTVLSLTAAALPLLVASAALADIPAGYKGTPFDPAIVGGTKCPATVKAGPYEIPGRLDFVNYDIGGDGVAYHTGDHTTKGGAGYRTDQPTATLSLTSVCVPNGGPPTCTNVWYDTSATLDGTPYPSATTADFSIGAVQNGDWVNITVNVKTAGMYTLSSTWASGAGPPGGEGGDGSMGLAVFSNNVQLATWSATFPNFNTTADFHHWKAYPNFATVTLAAGPQVIKLQSKAKHLQLDYVQFDLVGGGTGGSTGAGGSPATGGTTGAGGSPATGGSTGTTGTGGTTASGGTTGATGGDTGTTGTGGTTSTGTGGTTGNDGTGGTNAGGTTGSTAGTTGTKGDSKSGGCAIAPSGSNELGAVGVLLAFATIGLAIRRRR